MKESRIITVTPEEEGAWLSFVGGARAFFTWFWLIDHGQDEASLDPATLQRRVDTFALPAHPEVSRARIEEKGRTLVVEWASQAGPRTTRIGARLLAAMAAGEEDAGSVPGARRLWSAVAPFDEPPPLAYEDVVETEDGLVRCLSRIHEQGYAVVDGACASEAGARRLFERFGYIRKTLFGGLWRLSAELNAHEDTAYGNSYLAPHTDGTYSHDAPGLQSFACLEFDGTGGESILVDGFAAAQTLKLESPAHFDTLTRVSVPGRYVEPGVHLRARRPAVRVDETGTVIQVSLNNYDRAPFWLPAAEMRAFYEAYRALHDKTADRANWRLVPLRPGMALVFDNWRVLHGRMAYTGKRVFCGCYHNREDFESMRRAHVARESA